MADSKDAGPDNGSPSGLDAELAAIEAALVEAVRRPPGVRPGEGDVEDKTSASDSGSATEGSVPDEAEATAAPAVRRLTERQQSRLWRELREQPNFWETLNEIEPGAVARLAVLAEERRWEVLFITQRPSSAGDTCQLQTHRWLERQGFAHPNVYVIRGSRGRIAAALDIDVVIDDRPENCLDVVVDSKARPILIWRGDAGSPVIENARRMGIQVFGSFFECLESLAESTTAPGRFSLVGRFKGMWK